MASWAQLLAELEAQKSQEAADKWITDRFNTYLDEVSSLRGGTNVTFYSTAFLQKPGAPALTLQITHEDLNGFMAAVHQMDDVSAGLTLLLHTPGGVTNAAETVVAYLRSKFDKFEVIVPAFAMSAGTMISLASDRLVMGRQSQLGPIDPQMPVAATTRFVSARAVVDQFATAKQEIEADVVTAHAWAPILQSLGPGLLQEARNALDYGEEMVARWLATYMFKGKDDAEKLAKACASHFNDAAKHKSHGRRIDREEARSVGVDVEDLEDSQDLQDAVLSAYHLATLVYEKSPAAKLIRGQRATWVKNWIDPSSVVQVQPPAPVRGPAQGSRGTPSRQARREQERQQRKKK